MEKKNEKPPETVKIHVVDRDGRFEADPIVPVNVTIRAFIKSMGKKFNLPPEGPIKSGKYKGVYRYYHLINKRTGQFLRGGEEEEQDPRATKREMVKTFADYDVREGDTISVSEIIPGGDADRKRLEMDYKALKEIEKRAKDYITLKPSGDPPDFYEVELNGIPGIERIENDEPIIRMNHKFTIDLREEYYPVDKPRVNFITPIFHPYIFQNGLASVTDGWSPVFPLGELFVAIIDIIQYEVPISKRSICTPPNYYAYKWYIANKDKVKELIKPVSFLLGATNRHSENSMTEEDGGIRW